MTVGVEHRLILKSFTDRDYVFKRVKDSQAKPRANIKTVPRWQRWKSKNVIYKQTRAHFYDTIYSKQKKIKPRKHEKRNNPITLISIIRLSLISRNKY